jgi:hypothetical protein
VRQRAAELGDEGRYRLMREQDDVGRRDVVGDHHERLAAVAALRQGLLALGQDAQDARADVLDVVAARAQVRVRHLLEHLDQRVARLAQRGLGVDVMLADVGDGRFGDRAVVHHQDMGVDEGGDVAGRAGRDLLAHLAQLLLGTRVRAGEAGDLVLDLAGLESVFRRIRVAGVHLLHARDGDTAADADAGEMRHAGVSFLHRTCAQSGSAARQAPAPRRRLRPPV